MDLGQKRISEATHTHTSPKAEAGGRSCRAFGHGEHLYVTSRVMRNNFQQERSFFNFIFWLLCEKKKPKWVGLELGRETVRRQRQQAMYKVEAGIGGWGVDWDKWTDFMGCFLVAEDSGYRTYHQELLRKV